MTTENTMSNEGKTPENQDPNLPPATQGQPDQMVPLSRLNEEIQKRQEAEMRESQLRDQQLRMMAQQQPVYQQPTYQQPEYNETDDFDNVFTVDPKRAIESKLKAERQKFLNEAEARSRNVFHTEANKMMARNRYPDLNNPNSEFFKRVSFYMSTHPEKYNEPEGILDACARVREDMPSSNPTKQELSNKIVQQVASTATQVGGSSTASSNDVPRLSPEAQNLAAKLNIDPKKFATKLKNLEEGQGEYAPVPGKEGKARFIK